MAGFQELPLGDWSVTDVGEWLRAGHAHAAGWEKKLSSDYAPLFAVCAVDATY